MKLFYVTGIKPEANPIDLTHFIVAQIGKSFVPVQFSQTSYDFDDMFNEYMFDGCRFTIPRHATSMANEPYQTVSAFMFNYYGIQDVQYKPLTLDQIAYVKRHRSMYRDIVCAFYMYCDNSKKTRIYARLMEMLDRRPLPDFITFHECNVYRNNITNVRAKYKRLGQLVATALIDNDTTAVDSYLLNDCNCAGIEPINIFRKLKLVLDLDLVECDCGHLEREDDTHEIGRRGESTWCNDCFSSDAVYVEDRDEYWSRDDAYWSDYDDAYYSYERDQHDDDDGENEDPDNLMSYSTNVLHHVEKDLTIQSSPHGDFLMGIEFEMETSEGHYVSEAVDDVRQQLGESYCVCKSDGSLGHKGLEIVTAPRGLVEHIKRFSGWDVRSHYRAWDTNRCGLHVHIDSHAFTQMTLGKFVMFINTETNTDFIRRIAGRHPNKDDQARSYCASEYQPSLVNPKSAVKGKSSERYRMVNLQNLGARESLRLTNTRYYDGKYDTVELRIFRASLKKARMLAQIEFAHASVCFCRVASWRDLNQTSFVKWLKTVSSIYPNLANWYGVRRRNAKVTAESQCNDRVESV